MAEKRFAKQLALPSTASSDGDFDFKMVLLGQTGSGKTSFLNLLCNYGLILKLGYDCVDEFPSFNDVKFENTKALKMESKTNGAKIYKVEMGELKIGVIDTPGFGDLRGIEEDKNTTEKIVRILTAETYINCVCLVVNGRLARMTATLQYVMTEVTAILPRVVLNNIIVVFTNTADDLQLSFDPKEFKRFLGRDVEGEKIFYIENPYCRFVKAKEVHSASETRMMEIKKQLKGSFSETGKMLTQMCTVIKEFKPVYTVQFSELYETIQKIERSVFILLQDYDYQVNLEARIEEAVQAGKEAIQKEELHEKYQYQNTVKRSVVETTDKVNTLCGVPNCHSNCHLSCTIEPSLSTRRRCRCFWESNECSECGHSYEKHYHGKMKHKVVKRVVKYIDSEMKKKFEMAKSQKERAVAWEKKLNADRQVSEAKRMKLSENLLSTIEEFQKLGLTRNYLKVLQNQLLMVNDRLEGEVHGITISMLQKTKENIQKRIVVVQTTLDEPWSSDADPAAQIKWAQKILGVSPTATNKIIEQAYRSKAKTAHPDKVGDGSADYFMRIVKARDILTGTCT